MKFDFLGYSFQPRTTMSKKSGKLFLGFDCAISIGSKHRIAEKLKEVDIVYLTHKSIVGVAQFLEPLIRGWVNYYGRFRLSALNPIFQLLRRRQVMSLPQTPSFQHKHLYLIINLSSLIRPSQNKLVKKRADHPL